MKPTPDTGHPRIALRYDRLALIERARRSVIQDDPATPAGRHDPWIEPWIERSWRRCLANGHRPEQHLAFEQLSAQAMRHTAEANRSLVQVARPILDKLCRALTDTRYFAILTNASGVVVDVNGPIDRKDRRADLITRVGVDLSEKSVGTTAIGAALTELQPVWLHRGEHFFADTSAYSCAGAPLLGPDGRCVGMLDLTGVETTERPELRHLVAQSARSIENALTLQQAHSLLLRLNWPGSALGGDQDGLIALDADGFVTGANPTARQLVPSLSQATASALHSRDLFAMPFEMLFDAARHDTQGLEAPLWSGLRLQVLARLHQDSRASAAFWSPNWPMASGAGLPLRDVETALIQKAVAQAKGNVAQAARALGISRATVYRKLGKKVR
jgi:transcriptional regulator of acetoin/glycerol metabolism